MKKIIFLLMIQAVFIVPMHKGTVTKLQPLMPQARSYGLASLGLLKPTTINFAPNNNWWDKTGNISSDTYAKYDQPIYQDYLQKWKYWGLNTFVNKMPRTYIYIHPKINLVDRLLEDIAKNIDEIIHPNNEGDLFKYNKEKEFKREIEDFGHFFKYEMIKSASDIILKLYQKNPSLFTKIARDTTSHKQELINKLFKYLEDEKIVKDFMILLFLKILGKPELAEQYKNLRNKKEGFLNKVTEFIDKKLEYKNTKTQEEIDFEIFAEFLKTEIITQGTDIILKLNDFNPDLFQKIIEKHELSKKSLSELFDHINDINFKMKNINQKSFQELKKIVINILINQEQQEKEYFTDKNVDNLRILLWLVLVTGSIEITIKLNQALYSFLYDHTLVKRSDIIPKI